MQLTTGVNAAVERESVTRRGTLAEQNKKFIQAIIF